MGKRFCCKVGCEFEPEFEIWDENEQRPDIGATDSCKKHVGELLSSVPPTAPTGPWRITILREEVEICGHCGGIEGEGGSGRCPLCGGP